MWNEQRLNSVLDPIRKGGNGYRFAQLRHTPWNIATVDGGDIDLLGDEQSVAALIRHLYDLAMAGLCHFRVRRSGPDKTRVTLYAPDMLDRVELDLWVNLWQINGGYNGLRFEDVSSLLSGEGAIQHLPVTLEAALYLQHLIAKKKDVSTPTVQARLAHYVDVCRETEAKLVHQIEHLAETRQLGGSHGIVSERVIKQHIGRPLRKRGLIESARRVLQPFPKLVEGRVLAFIGCDGVGKTSVGEAIAKAIPQIEPMLAKQLYRRSLTFRGAYKLNKATIKRPSEWVDEKIAPLAFSRARKALLAKLPQHRGFEKGILLLDRYLADFLYVGRKQAASGFAKLGALCMGKSMQCSIVHFVLPYPMLAKRKQEVPEANQRAYDLAMIGFYTRSDRATDYLVYCNSGTVDDATAAISQHIRERFRFEPAPATPAAESASLRTAVLERQLVGRS